MSFQEKIYFKDEEAMGSDVEKALGHKHTVAPRKQSEMKISRTVLSKQIVSRLLDTDKYYHCSTFCEISC